VPQVTPHMLRQLQRCLFCAAFLAGTAFSSETFVGTVWNGTTGKPAAGDDIVLLTLVHDSLEVSRSKTNSDGSFRLRSDVSARHLLRVRHDGVIYQQQVSETDAIRVNVFDAISKADAALHGTVTIMKMESTKNVLYVTELHAIVNDSSPPRTVVNPRSIEILIPKKATLDTVLVSAPSGHPEKVTPKPPAHGSQQLVVGYPLRPGSTQIAISYHLPYSDKIALHPWLQYPTQLWSVAFPSSMQFKPLEERRFNELPDQNGIHIRAVPGARAGFVPGFVISGDGRLPHAQTLKAMSTMPVPPPSMHSSATDQPRISPRGPGSKPARGTLGWVPLLGLVFIIGMLAIGMIAVLRSVSSGKTVSTTKRNMTEPKVQRDAA